MEVSGMAARREIGSARNYRVSASFQTVKCDMNIGFGGAKSKVPILATAAKRCPHDASLRTRRNRAYDAFPISSGGTSMSAFLLATALVVIGLYAYFAVAPGAASIPVQWSLGGGVNWSAPRPVAFGLIPAVGLVAIAVLSMLGVGATIGGIVILGAEVLHVLMVRNWHAKSQAGR
jgi:hypothetical protein